MKHFNYFMKFALALMLITGCGTQPGSYPNAELYPVKVNEGKLIEAVEDFKERNPEYNVPKDVPLRDGRRNEQDSWHHFYFFDAQSGRIIKTWVSDDGGGNALFALIAVYNPDSEKRWEFVNKDLSFSKNNEIKETFKSEIFKPITVELLSD